MRYCYRPRRQRMKTLHTEFYHTCNSCFITRLAENFTLYRHGFRFSLISTNEISLISYLANDWLDFRPLGLSILSKACTRSQNLVNVRRFYASSYCPSHHIETEYCLRWTWYLRTSE
jgi:hypothetical protein